MLPLDEAEKTIDIRVLICGDRFIFVYLDDLFLIIFEKKQK